VEWVVGVSGRLWTAVTTASFSPWQLLLLLMIPSVDLSVRLYRLGLLRSRLRLCSPSGLAAELLCPGVGLASAPSLRRIRVASSVCREVGDAAVEVAPALNLLRLMILRCGSALVSGGVVRLVVSSFAKGGMIYLSPWDAFSGPSSLVALDLGWWAMRSEEGGISGVASSSLVRELLMCHSGNRCVMVGAPWRWLLQRFQALKLLGGETNFSSLVGAGGRRCSARTEARKTKGLIVIFVFWRSSL